MTKRNGRTRRHGTNEMATDGRKGRVSPIVAGSENIEYTMIDLVRSVERLHFCKSGDRKDTVMWTDVKKHYKKTTGRVLSTEAFNKLAGVTGASRKDLIAGPLAGLLVAEDPAALVLRFKYDANKGDPLINHRYYLEASGAKTTVHNAPDALPPRRLADLTNTGNGSTVSPSRSETSSASLSPTCLSQISTDPDTEALSPVSTSSPLSSAPLSPDTREYVTANDDQPTVGDSSFMTARTSPMTSDWETSPSSRGTATPDGSPSNYDQEKTLNLLDVSHGTADETIGASEILRDMVTPVKDEEVVRGEEEEKAEKIEEEKREDSFEDGSNKENHLVESAALSVAKPVEATETAADDVDVVSHPPPPSAVDEVVDVPDAIEEVEVETSPHPQKEKEHEGEEEKETSEPAEVVESTEEEKKVDEKEEEEGEVERQEEREEEHDLAAGDGPVPLQEEESAPPSLPSTPVPVEKDEEKVVEEMTTTTFSSSDETLLTVIERGPTIVHDEDVEEHKQEEQEEEREERMEGEDGEKKEDEVVQVEKKVEEPAAGDSSAAAAAVVEESIVEDQVTEVVGECVVKEDEEEEERSKRVKRQTSPVEEVKEMGKQPDDDVRMDDEVVVVDTVVNTEPVAQLSSAAPEPVTAVTEDAAHSITEEPTTMVSPATVAPMVQPKLQQLQTPPPPPSHEPMETISLNSYSSSSSLGTRHIDRPPSPTSDDVDMNDVLAGGPALDVHTPSVTAPITLQPKPASRAQPEEEDDSEMITHQPVIDESDAPSTTLAAISPKDDGTTAATPDDLALRRAQPAKKFPCCTIV